MKNVIAKAAVVATVLAGGVIAAGPAQAAHHPSYDRVTYCKHADGAGQKFCLWDAKVQGHGHGCTYLVLNGRFLPLKAVHGHPRHIGPECPGMH